MNTTQQNNSHVNRLNVITFKPQSEDELEAAEIIRTMLRYWKLRVTLESNFLMAPLARTRLKRTATAIRLEGFRAERNLKLQLAQGMPLFDDQELQQAGTRIAYMVARVRFLFKNGDAAQARAVHAEARSLEEDVITLSINRALYGIDLDKVRIAA
jgi:hypothetical protein